MSSSSTHLTQSHKPPFKTDTKKAFNAIAWYTIFIILMIRDVLEIYTSSQTNSNLSDTGSINSQRASHSKKMLNHTEIDDNFNLLASVNLICVMIAIKGIYSRDKNLFRPVIVSLGLLSLFNLISILLVYDMTNLPKFYDSGLMLKVRKFMTYFEVDIPNNSVYWRWGWFLADF